MKSHRALLLGMMIALAVLIVAGLLYWFVLKSPQVVVQTTPNNAEIFLDGNKITGSRIKSTIGTHTVKVSLTGYVTYEKQVTLNRAEQLILPILLKPVPSPTTIVVVNDYSNSFLKSGNLFYLGDKGQTIYQVSTHIGQVPNQAEPITPNTLSGIQKMAWRPDGSIVLMKKADGVYLYDFNRYDLLHQTSTLWGTGIDEVIWSPDGTKTAYTYYGPNNEQSLILADVQNKNISRAANLTIDAIDHPTISWSPDGKSILLVGRSSQAKTNFLYLFDIFSHKISRLSSDGNVVGATWSPDSKYIAYVAPGRDQLGNTNNMVWLAQVEDKTIKPLNVAVDSIDRVGWLNDSQSLILTAKQSTGNRLVNVKLNGEVSNYQYFQPAGQFSPDHLQVIPKEDRVMYFNNGYLQSLSLTLPNYE